MPIMEIQQAAEDDMPLEFILLSSIESIKYEAMLHLCCPPCSAAYFGFTLRNRIKVVCMTFPIMPNVIHTMLASIKILKILLVIFA